MNSINGRHGQAGGYRATADNRRPSFTIGEVKALHPPRWYYPGVLQGHFGKLTNGGWCLWQGLCPFHVDTHPGSVSINLTTGAFKCFACGASAGDVLAFHGKLKGLGLREVLVELGGAQ